MISETRIETINYGNLTKKTERSIRSKISERSKSYIPSELSTRRLKVSYLKAHSSIIFKVVNFNYVSVKQNFQNGKPTR